MRDAIIKNETSDAHQSSRAGRTADRIGDIAGSPGAVPAVFPERIAMITA